MALRLYLDTNVLCRPFDDQTIGRIRRETEAFERILDKISQDEVALVVSEILVFELRGIVSPDKRAKASGYLYLAKDHHDMTEETLSLARRVVEKFKLQPRDALHMASALLAESSYFLTCDDGITKRFKKRPLSASIGIQRRTLRVLNPVDFIGEMQW